MSFGAIITTGDDNEPLRDGLAQWLTEARVEQELSKPTKFAIRFEDDLCGDGRAVEDAPELAANRMLAVLVPSGNKTLCLVRGRITRVRSAAQLGGPGSWVEVHGESRKVEMDRETVQASWEGQEDKIVESVLSGYDFTPHVANVQTKNYTATDQLNQRGTDLAFLDKIASENGVEFWISYGVESPNPLTGAYTVNETAHFRISPEAPDFNEFNLSEFRLSAEDADAPSFRINVPRDQCPNVTAFNVTVDTERPNRATGATIEADSGETTENETTADPATTGEGRTLDAIDGVTRTIVTSGPGGGTDQGRRDEAALREASWFVEATVSTSAHLLKGRVIVPHEIINVEGAGWQFSLPYQVKSVTHVVNAADHMMDVKLRSNVIAKRPQI